MSALRYYDIATGTWKTLATVQGPQGPQGATGPAGPAVLDFQRLWCTAGAYRTTSFVGTVAYHVPEITATMGAPNLIINLNLPVPFWWDTTHQNGLIRKDDAAYHYIYTGLRLLPADQDGISTGLSVTTQHSAVDTYMNGLTRRTFRCAANTNYQLQAIMGGGNGGTWNYNKSVDCWLEGRAFAQ